jgi:nitrite reductase (NADH) small subunit
VAAATTDEIAINRQLACVSFDSLRCSAEAVSIFGSGDRLRIGMVERMRVADAAELPDDTGTVVQANGKEIALFKVGDEVFAIDNECPHREGPLGFGDLSEDIVTCPFHAWQINVRTGEVVDFPSMCARTYPCRVVDGGVYLDV